MRLEEELKQEAFQSVYQKAVLSVLFTGNWMDADSNRRLKPFGISSQQYNVLRILKGQGGKGISVSEIMSRMIDKMSNASRLVEKLRQKGLIERITCEHDRRQVDVVITTKGSNLLKEATKEMDGLEDFKSKITEKEARLISEILEKIRD